MLRPYLAAALALAAAVLTACAPQVKHELPSCPRASHTVRGILPSRVLKARRANEVWETETARLALERAKAVAEVVVFCGGNQSAAARAMNMDQSTVNKLVQKVRRAEAAA